MTLLTRYGRALWGRNFRAPMSRHFRVHEKTVRRWIKGDHTPPEGVLEELREMVAKRAKEAADLAELG